MFFGGFGLAEATSNTAEPAALGAIAATPSSRTQSSVALHLVQAPIEPASRREPVVTTQLVLIDLLAVGLVTAATFFAIFGLRNATFTSPTTIVAALPLVWVAVTAAGRGYDPRFIGVGSAEFAKALRTFINVSLVFAVVSYVGRLEVSRAVLLAALPGSLVAVWVGRYAARVRLHRLRRAGRSMNRVLAVGSAASVAALAESMRRDPSTGLHVVAACLPENEPDDPTALARLAVCEVAVAGAPGDVARTAADWGARSVAVVAGDVGTAALRSISWALEGTGRDLMVSTGLVEVADRRLHVQSVAGLPLLRVDEPVFDGFRPALKSAFDHSAAAAALLLLAPLFAVVALLVRCTSAGPAFYRQTRVGRNGEAFRMTKFRSMYRDSDARRDEMAELNEVADGLLFKVRNDPRITPVGRFIRRTSIDELPQLLQVLIGRMSLVGPRPPLPCEVDKYDDDVRRRLLVKPGLTGLWQVSGRSDLSWADSVRLDLHYVENWSLGLDMVVLLKTARAVVRAKGAY